MSKQYVKHDREVTTEQLQKYGKYATHDIHVPILLLYPVGNISDAKGTMVKIDDDFMKCTMKATNSAIKKRHNSVLAKAKSFFTNDVNDYEIIPILKNHNTSDVDGVVGHTKGLAYLSEISGVACLLIDSVIKDPETISKIEGDLFRNTSLGTRADGSIKEISIVSNEALAHGGFLMSEPEITPIIENEPENIPTVSKQELLLAEEINELKLQEHTLENITIPNHIILSRMIKNGKIEPWKYDNLIQKLPEIVQLMEQSLPSNKLGIMYGTKRTPQKMDVSDTVISEIISTYQKTTGKTDKKTKETEVRENSFIKQSHSFEEVRQKELKHILELAEYSPEIARNYISYELGEEINPPVSNDKYLSEYIQQSKDIKSKLNNLEIQLGEFKNG